MANRPDFEARLAEATTLEEIKALAEEQQAYILDFSEPGYEDSTPEFFKPFDVIDAVRHAESLGIPLIEHVNEDRFRIADLGFGTDPAYLDYLTESGWLPEVDNRGWEQHRIVDGYIAISYNQEDRDFMDFVMDAGPGIILAVAMPSLAPALATTLGVSNAVAQGIVSAGVAAANGGDFGDILTAGLTAYGISDIENIAGAVLDLVPDSVINAIPDAVFDVFGGDASALTSLTENEIFQLAQTTIEQNPEAAEAIEPWMSTFNIPNLYDKYKDWEESYEGPSGEYDIPILDFPAGGEEEVPGGSEGGGEDTPIPEPAPEPAPAPPPQPEPAPADPSDPMPDAGENPPEIGEEDDEKPWIYTGNGVFVHKDTGERITDPDAAAAGTFVVGGSYGRGDDGVAEEDVGVYLPTTPGPDSGGSDNGFDMNDFMDWVYGKPSTGNYTPTYEVEEPAAPSEPAPSGSGTDSPSPTPDGSGEGTDSPGGQGDDPGDGTEGEGEGDGDGTGDGSESDPKPEFDPKVLLGLLPLLTKDEEEEKTYTGNARPQDTSTLYEKPTYDDVEQKPLLEPYDSYKGMPSVKPASNSDIWDQEEWMKEDEYQKGLLNLIAPKKKRRGLI